MNIVFRQSPNFTADGITPIGVILHGTMGGYNGAIEWLCTPPKLRAPVSYSSAHFVIAKDGRCTQIVKTSDQAWHAGVVNNPTEYAKSVLPKEGVGYKNPNTLFIGIELEYFIGDVIPQTQLDTLIFVIKSLKIKNPIILAHKEIAQYKGDFETLNGKIDNRIVDAVKARIALKNENLEKDTAIKKIDELKEIITKTWK